MPDSLLARRLSHLSWHILLLLALTFPFEKGSAALRVGPLIFTNVEIVMLLALVTWGLSLAISRRWPQIPAELRWPALVWLLTLTLSALQAPSHQVDAWKFTTRMVAGVLVGWMTYDLTRRWGKGTLLARALALAGILVAAIGLGEILGWPPAIQWTLQFRPHPTRVGDVVRLTSTLVYATITSMVLELTIPLVLAWVMVVGYRLRHPPSGFARARRLLLLAGLGVLLIGLVTTVAAQVLTLSRAGIIALGTAFLLTGGMAWKQRQRWWAYAGVGIGMLTVGTMVALFAVQPVVALRLVSETERYWYQAEYEVPAEWQARPGETVRIPVRVRNVGLRTWTLTPPYPFNLSYHLYQENGRPLTYEGARTSLPHPVARGQEIQVDAIVIAPTQPGTYLVAWDMVQEAVTWFSWKGNETPNTRLVVTGPPVPAPPALPPSAPPTDVRLQVPAPGRLTLWRTALRMFIARPLLGVGPDNFRLVYGVYAGVDRWDMGIHANNMYVEWLADTGLLGFLAFLWLTVALARGVWRRWAEALRAALPSRIWQMGLTASLMAWFVHGVFDYFYEFMPTLMAFWMLVGLALSQGDGD